jgi:cytoskeletal protein RodZ
LALQYQEKVMSPQFTQKEYASLGEYLRETRINLGRDLAAVADETRIPPKSLQAIEESDFVALPAEAYTRGFYALYAKSLLLDPEEVLQMYTQERPNRPKSINTSMLPQGKLAQEVGNMAERPSFVPFSFFGLILLLLLLLGGFLCWYFSWNPATYLSQKLRSLEETKPIEQVSKNQPDPSKFESRFRFVRPQNPLSKHQALFDLSYPATAAAAIAEDIAEEAPAPPPPHVSKYFINAEFNEETSIKLKIDNLPEQILLFKTGDSASWRAKEKAVITLPAQTKTKLTLNHIPLDYPDTDEEFITLHLPEQLQQ